ncbi:MAG: DUF3800 domain-containing protein [Pseudonocardiaceae bacterium]
MPVRALHAFIDEAGQRARTPASSSHFVMAAVVIADEHLASSVQVLAQLREDLGRRPGDTLHWQNLKGHSPRLHAAKTIGSQQWITVSSVVVCKTHLSGSLLNDDQSYLYTFRYLLERLSWLARDQGRELHYTLAHIVRFKLAKLRQYETALRHVPGCQIVWSALDPRGGRLDQPSRIEQLQLADTCASAIFRAFEPDDYGNTETRYLQELARCLYRRGAAPLTSYGLKIHPTNARAAYPWVAAL